MIYATRKVSKFWIKRYLTNLTWEDRLFFALFLAFAAVIVQGVFSN